jgi:Co/Zn/Cd efflux system component
MMDHDDSTSVSTDPLHNVIEKKLSKSESALNFAFLSFLAFTIFQFVFAVAARSDAMLADCAGMVNI